MSAPLTRAAYAELLRIARRHSRRADEAEDLLHDALLASLVAGAPSGVNSRAWLHGVVRKQALMQARGAARRRRRETAWQAHAPSSVADVENARAPAPDLPSSLRVVLLLSLTGHSRAEIRHLLRLSDQALRQRIASLRKRLAGSDDLPREPLLLGRLAFGSIRRSLLPAVRRLGHFATHDPDGHAMIVGFSPRPAHGTARGGN